MSASLPDYQSSKAPPTGPATDSPTLILDAGSRAVHLGLRTQNGNWHLRTTEVEAGVEGMFPKLKELFAELGVHPTNNLEHVLFCGGPGSLLGLRTVAMVLATWDQLRSTPLRLHRYHALDLAHACLRRQLGSALPERFQIISEWKRGLWQTLPVSESCAPRATVLKTEELAHFEGPSFLLEQRKQWSKLPTVAEPINYTLAPFTTADAFPANILEPVRTPDLLTPGNTDYQKWNTRRPAST